MSYTSGNIEFKTVLFTNEQNKEILFLNGIESTVEDLLSAALYVLTNTTLITENDPKEKFLRIVKNMITHEDANGKRIILIGDEDKSLLGYSFLVASKL